MEEDENIRRAGDVTAVPDDVMRLAEALSETSSSHIS